MDSIACIDAAVRILYDDVLPDERPDKAPAGTPERYAQLMCDDLVRAHIKAYGMRPSPEAVRTILRKYPLADFGYEGFKAHLAHWVAFAYC